MSSTMTDTLAINGGTPVRTKPPLPWPVHGLEEEQRLVDVVRSGQWWWGKNVGEFEEKFAAFQGAKYGVTACNGTISLQIILRTLGVTAGDEVIVPGYTFIASATAVTQLNAIPVFADVEADTANIDFEAAEKLITNRTRAIIVVHFAGLPVDMDRAKDFAARHNLKLIEDACHSWGSQWNGKGTGAIAHMGCFSFQVSKNMTAAEGGIILTDDPELAAIARSYTHVGRLADKPWYEHHLLGGNNRMTEFQAAVLLAQLERLESQTARRMKNAQFLEAQLGQIPGFSFPPCPAAVTRRGFHMLLFRFHAKEFGISRDDFLKALQAEGVPGGPGYLHPVYKNPCFQNLNDRPRPEDRTLSETCNTRGIRYDKVCCPVAEQLCREEMIWLPHVLLLEDDAEIGLVAEAFKKVYRNRHSITA